MKLSIRLSSDLDPDQLLHGAEAAAGSGIGRCWLADNPHERSALVTAGALGAKFPDLSIGVGTSNARIRHPAVLAQDAATAADYVGGDFALGLGVGFDAQRTSMGLPRRSGLAVLRDTVGDLRGLFGGHAVSFTDDAGATPVALKCPTRLIPILIGAMGPKTLQLAGTVADGVVLSLGTSVTYLRQAVELARDARASTGDAVDGQGDFQTIAYVMYGGECSTDEAHTRLAPAIAPFVGFVAKMPRLLWIFEGTGIGEDEVDVLSRRLAAGEDPVDVIPLELVRALAIWGSPQDSARRLADYADAGVGEVALGFGEWMPDLGEAISAAARIHGALS